MTTIIQHGLRWFFNNDRFECPECKKGGAWGLVFIQQAIENKDTATIKCVDCGCIFKQQRDKV